MAEDRLPSPFAGTALYYAPHRAPYPHAAINLVVAAYTIAPRHRALYLGCGPGTIAIPLSHAAGEILAVDPDAGMLAEARRRAASQHRHNISWQQARAEDIPPGSGLFRVATLGQSFHWMDRDLVLHNLATLIEPGGGLALLNPGKRRPQESWEPTAEQVITRFLGPRRRHPNANPQEPANEPALRRSACFATFTTHEFATSITRDIASIAGCIYSNSSSPKHLFADRAPAFEAALSTALFALNPSGTFHERIETEVTLAPRKRR